ncbi:MAG TPA: large-conductance mechanosensitive channel protein MscL, partial [Anaerolineaceae bacterium]|nr:large-conductance mechanosensitive channel protein MscL [Anaerolineaceae bacterium]
PMLKEFKEFAMRGNLIDLAIGIIIGSAFGKIISSFVNDIVMPPIGMLLGKVNFADLFVPLDGKTYASLQVAKDAGAPTLNYGLFINNIIDFLIVAFVIFLVVRAINKMKKPAPVAAPAAPATKECPYCYSTIAIKATRCPNCTSEVK